MPKTEQERLEIVQDLIDRLLYLDEYDSQVFTKILNSLFHDFPVHYEVVDGIRVYKSKQNGKDIHV